MKKAIICTAFGILSVAPVHAAVNTLIGNNYDLVYDDQTVGLFGIPTLIGDNIIFTPNNFKAQSYGAGLDVESSTVNGLYLVAKNGFKFNSIELKEFGDYFIDGAGQVNVLGQLRAFDATPNAAPNVPFLNQSVSNLVVSSTTPLNLNDGNNHNWLAESAIYNSTPTLFGGNSGWLSNAGKVGLTVENILKAYSPTNAFGIQSAFIEKKFAGIGLVITAIPEPSIWNTLSAGLMVIGLMALREKNIGL